jgi:hypothetical protein
MKDMKSGAGLCNFSVHTSRLSWECRFQESLNLLVALMADPGHRGLKTVSASCSSW